MSGSGLYMRIVIALAVGFAAGAGLFLAADMDPPDAIQADSVPAVAAPAPVIEPTPAPAPEVRTLQASTVPGEKPKAAQSAPQPMRPKQATRVRIPDASVTYRLAVERAVVAEFGLAAPIDIVAAQLHQESLWRADAQSPYALGLAQFTPETAKWLPEICPQLGGFDPWDAGQSIRAAACYDRWLHGRNNGATTCDRFAMMLSDYNGGMKWRKRDQALAAKEGRDATRWFDHVEGARSRSVAAHKENRNYVDRVLRVLAPAYADAGWPQAVSCA